MKYNAARLLLLNLFLTKGLSAQSGTQGVLHRLLYVDSERERVVCHDPWDKSGSWQLPVPSPTTDLQIINENYLYAVHEQGTFLIDLRSRKAVGKISRFKNVSGAGILSDGRYVIAASDPSAKITFLDRGGNPINSIELDGCKSTTQLRVRPDDSFDLACLENARPRWLRLDKRGKVMELHVLPSSCSVVADTIGGKIWFGGSDAPIAYLYERNGKLERTINLKDQGYMDGIKGLCPLQNGNLVCSLSNSRGTSEVVEINLNGEIVWRWTGEGNVGAILIMDDQDLIRSAVESLCPPNYPAFGGLGDRKVSDAHAYRIQMALNTRLERHLGRQIGYKIDLPYEKDNGRWGLENSVAAAVFEDQLLLGRQLPLTERDFRAPSIGIKVVITMGSDITAPVEKGEELKLKVASVGAALEFCDRDSLLKEKDTATVICGGGGIRSVKLGKTITGRRFTATDLAVRLTSKNVNLYKEPQSFSFDTIIEELRVLANRQIGFHRPLRKGQVVLVGGLYRDYSIQDFPRGKLTLTIEGLPPVSSDVD